MADSPLAWGIVGPGGIAEVFAASVTAAGVGTVAGAFGRDRSRREDYCARFGGRAAESLAELCGRDDVDAIYVATPHPAHEEAVLAALTAGKPVLCEKPLTLSMERTAELYQQAKESGVLLMEGWMYRNHPQIDRAYMAVAAGEIGEVQRFHSWFGFAAPYDPAHRLWNSELGGGGIYDVGGYPLSLMLRFASCEDPELVAAEVSKAPTGVDQDATAHYRFREGDGLMLKDAEVELRCSLVEELGRGAVLEGTEGRLVIDDPFLPGGERLGRRAELHLERDGKRESIVVEAELDCFALQAKCFAATVAAGELEAPHPLVDFYESLLIVAMLEEWAAC